MIITRYLISEILKSQFAIIFILFLIFFCQKLVRILNSTINGNVPPTLILSLLELGVPEMAQLILPMSLFLGLLMTLSRMYTENEIMVMHACGFGKNILIRAALMLSLITSVFAAINIIWVSPWSVRHQHLIILEAKVNPNISSVLEGQFKLIANGNLVLFVSNVKGKEFEHIFLAQLKQNGNIPPFIATADRGCMTQQLDGSQLIILDDGTLYEGTAQLLNFRITKFNQYKAIINHQPIVLTGTNAEQMTLYQLWKSSELEARNELHYRLTLVISVLIMAMIAVPLSVINSRKGRVLSILPGLFLYLIFFLIQTSLRANGAKGKINPIFWIWLTNVMYLVIALILNFWDSISARRLIRHIRVRR